MELWIWFAILSAIFAGIFSFCHKIAAEHNYSPSRLYLYSSAVQAFFTAVYIILFSADFSAWRILLVVAFVNAATYYFAVTTRIESLKNIHTTIYFPIYKTLGPIFATVLGVLYFKDQLSSFEVLGILLGIIVPLFLISKSEKAIQKNIPRGLRLLLVGAVLTVFTGATGKYVIVHDLDIPVYILFTFLFNTIIAGLGLYRENGSGAPDERSGLGRFVAIISVVHILAFATFTLAMRGDFSVVYTINAFSILIPIVLSVWWFKEHMNFRKGFVIFLSIVSVIFFAL